MRFVLYSKTSHDYHLRVKSTSFSTSRRATTNQGWQLYEGNIYSMCSGHYTFELHSNLYCTYQLSNQDRSPDNQTVFMLRKYQWDHVCIGTSLGDSSCMCSAHSVAMGSPTRPCCHRMRWKFIHNWGCYTRSSLPHSTWPVMQLRMWRVHQN